MLQERLQQLTALTAIRRTVEKYFPNKDFYYMEAHLCEEIGLEDYESIEYDGEAYYIKTPPSCKVCQRQSQLTEVPTLTSKFYICKDCMKDIAAAKPVQVA